MDGDKEIAFDFFRVDEPKLSKIDCIKRSFEIIKSLLEIIGVFNPTLIVLIVIIFLILLLLTFTLVIVNSAFLAFAIVQALSLAIMNAYDFLMPLFNAWLS